MRATLACTLLLLAGCGSPQVDANRQAVQVDHTCTVSRLPTTCGLPPEQLPCCALHTPDGEEQLACCPSGGFFVHKLCAAGVPQCQHGEYLQKSCKGLVCPPLSWPCAEGCCNACGQIGPLGCCIIEADPFDASCGTFGVPGRDICMGQYQYQSKTTRVSVPDGAP
jgi:hypothetical protein